MNKWISFLKNISKVYYDDEMRKTVYNAYEKDFRIFNYQPEINITI